VSTQGKARPWIIIGAIAGGLLLIQQFWYWEVERVDVKKDTYLVKVHRWGKELPEDEIVAPDDSYKGVVLAVEQEGRHFLNPLFWSYEIHPIVKVAPGKALIVARKFGKRIPNERLAQGDVLSLSGLQDIDVVRGILRDPLGPGNYRLNPYAFSWQEIAAIEIGPGQVGVRTLKVGTDPRTLPAAPDRSRYVVPDGYKGVQQTPVSNGTYYLNPFVETIVPVEVRSHTASLSDIEFPSRDGFILKPYVTVEYQVRREKAPEVMVRLTDEGMLHQLDATPQQQQENEILQKVILPHMRGYARIEGSNFDARDFILAAVAPANQQNAINPRERMQKALLDKIRPRCEELGIEIRSVLLGEMKPPAELAEQISMRDLARVEQQKNAVRVRQFREMQKLSSVQTLKEQAREKVEAETRLQVMKTQAKQQMEVEKLKLEQELENAQIGLEAARSRSQAMLSKGKAAAAVIQLQNEAEVAGLKTAIQGFTSAATFAQYHVITKLAPSLTEIFASDDSDFAKLFSGLMTPPAGQPPKSTLPVTEKIDRAPGGVERAAKK
jgi:SPFH domain / Band 7 family